MILRWLGRLLGLVAFLVLGGILLGARWAKKPVPSSGRRPAAEPPAEGSMVRDRVCNTFLPRDRALTLREGGGELFFCSAACRDLHRSRTPSRS